MLSFTKGTTPQEVVERRLPRKYPMDLNKKDMLMLLDALNEYAGYGYGRQPSAEESERADSLRGGILETLGIEEV